MFETYPKGGKTCHKKVPGETMESGWGGDPTKTKYPQGSLHGSGNTYKSKQHSATFAKGGGSAQVSASYPQKSGKNGVNFDTNCNY